MRRRNPIIEDALQIDDDNVDGDEDGDRVWNYLLDHELTCLILEKMRSPAILDFVHINIIVKSIEIKCEKCQMYLLPQIYPTK